MLRSLPYDAVVIGGGPAGLSAALTLGRARRRVLLAAHGPTRNASASAAHNVFTRDGTPPAELVRIGREQLAPYDVEVRDARAEDAERMEDGIAVTFADGRRVEARGLVLATGVRDVLPEIPGFAELWGGGVFHCPYCHGWEVAGRPLAVYDNGEHALHLCQLLKGWSDDVALFTGGPSTLSTDDRDQLERNGIAVFELPVTRLLGSKDGLEAVVLADGRSIARGGLIMAPRQEQRSRLPHRLGCPLTAEGRIEADGTGRTPIPGVFVAGDAGPGVQSVTMAMASGTIAGATLNHDFLAADFRT